MTESFRPTSFRNKAREALSGIWNMAAVAFLVYEVLNLTTIYAFGYKMELGNYYSLAVCFFFTIPLSMGCSFLFLDVSNRKGVRTETLFEAFRSYVRYVTAGVLMVVYIILWMLLFVIPGIVKLYSYSMTFYIMRENPGMDGEQAIQLSMRMMHGRKWDYFKLHLSFMGWLLLGLLTLGVGLLWLFPYICTAEAEFYKELKKEYEAREGLSA